MSLPSRILDVLRDEPDSRGEAAVVRAGNRVLEQASRAADRALVESQRLDLQAGIPAGSTALRAVAEPARWVFLSAQQQQYLVVARLLVTRRGRTLSMLRETATPDAVPDRLVAELAQEAVRQVRAAVILTLRATADKIDRTPRAVGRRVMRLAKEHPNLLRDADLTWEVLSVVLDV